MRILLAPPLVVVTLAAGVWFWSGVVAPGYWTAIGFGVAWFVACSVLFGRAGKARPALRPWLRGTFLACSAAAVVGFWWTSIRATEVNETIVTGVPASRLEGSEVAVADALAPQPEAPVKAKRKLTLSDGLRIDPGPRVRVYLATDAGGATFEDLGGLTVVFWCVPLSVSLASANLRAA